MIAKYWSLNVCIDLGHPPLCDGGHFAARDAMRRKPDNDRAIAARAQLAGHAGHAIPIGGGTDDDAATARSRDVLAALHAVGQHHGHRKPVSAKVSASSRSSADRLT